MAKITRHGGASNYTSETPEVTADDTEDSADDSGVEDTEGDNLDGSDDLGVAPIADAESEPLLTTTASRRGRRSGF